jgi:hypothetical protein
MKFKREVIAEIKAAREVGIKVSKKAEKMALDEAPLHEHMTPTEFVDMCADCHP